MGRRMKVIALAAVLAALAAFPAQAAPEGSPPTGYQAAPEPPTIVADRPASVREATTALIGGSFGNEEKGRLGPLDTCRYIEIDHGRGAWPYHRVHVAGTYWCFVWASHVTYRRTATTWRVDPLCWREAHENHRISGGVGYSWVEIHSEVWFACHTPWWFDLHDSLWMNIAYNVWGNAAVTGHNT